MCFLNEFKIYVFLYIKKEAYKTALISDYDKPSTILENNCVWSHNKGIILFPEKWFLASSDNDCDVSNLCNYSHNTLSDIAPTTNLELLAWNKEVTFLFRNKFSLVCKTLHQRLHVMSGFVTNIRIYYSLRTNPHIYTHFTHLCVEIDMLIFYVSSSLID